MGHGWQLQPPIKKKLKPVSDKNCPSANSQGLIFSAQIGALQFFISTADYGISVDGALDSIEVRAGDVAPIPLPPASGLLLPGGMGGLTFMRRRKKA